MIGDEQYSASRVGGYLLKNIYVFEGDSLHLEIKSDIVSESGRAAAIYSVSGQELTVNIKNSNTPFYEPDSSLTFNPYEIVDEDYRETLQNDSVSYTFEGPGLLLQVQKPDLQDLDKDGDTSEMIFTTEYYSFTGPNN